MNPRRLLGGALAAMVGLPMAACSSPRIDAAATERWWRGNTHTHTYWSDGNAAPEHVIDWYRRHDYDFLVLSDHNILSRGETWFPISTEGSRPLTPSDVECLEHRFGPKWVVVRDGDDGPEMRLKTLAELRDAFERPGEFIMIEGEEITDHFEAHEVHVNGLNLVDVIPPQGGVSVRDTIQRNIDAVIAHGRIHARPVLAHVNHPNFRRSLTPEDVASIRGERFFEVYNGHRGVFNEGDDVTPSTEEIWDIALTLRLTSLRLGLLYGLATDDAHDHHGRNATSTPGRGWVWVRAPALTASSIIEAMRQGAFYASSGVRLRDFGTGDGTLWLSIDPEPGVTYTTEFIGTRICDGMPLEIGAVLATTTSHCPEYRLPADALYVRARVTSSRLHPNPFAAGDREMAWVQPRRGPAAE